MEDIKLNEKESFELIARMIQNTQNKLSKGQGNYFLIWGYVTLLTTIGVFLTTTFTGDYRWNFLWFAIPVIGYPLFFINRRNNPKGIVTYLDQIIGYIWITFGVVVLLFSIISITQLAHINILLIILLLGGMGCTLTGLIIKFPYCIFAGFLTLVLSISILFVNSYYYYYLVMSIAFIVMMIIPGHILNYKGRKQCLKN